MACIGQMQHGTSLVRFVGEHLVRHAKPSRENLPVEPGLLPHAPARRFHRTLRAAAHVLRGWNFGRDQRAALHQGRCLPMDEVPAPVRNPLVQTTDQLGQLPVAVRATGFPRPLAL